MRRELDFNNSMIESSKLYW